MWPFKKKPAPPSAHPCVQPLNAAEEDWLHQQRDSFKTLSLAAGLPMPDPDHTLEWADALVRWWHSMPAENRIHANLIACAAAVALGDALAAALDMRWAIVTDGAGTNIGLCWSAPGAEPGRGQIVLSPTQSIAKNFAGSPDGFIVGLFAAMVPETRGIQQRMSSA